MRLHVLHIALLGWSLTGTAQDLVRGQLTDSVTLEILPFAHVTNYNTALGTTTDEYGWFRIPASVGDTIVFSSVGYQTMGWVVRESWFTKGPVLRLPQDTTWLEEVTVYRIPPESVFKQRILEMKAEDTSFWYHGMPEPGPLDNAPLSEKVLRNPLFIATHPTDFLYYKFSKQEKEKRKYHQITQNEQRRKTVSQKFTRAWVSEVTSLQGEELTYFIDFCDYTEAYIERTPLYIIREDLLAKLEKFRKMNKC